MSRRTERVAEAIREVVAKTVLFEMSDPRVRGVTVTRAEITGDLRYAKVFVSLMGDDKTQRLALAGLQHARGFLQRRVGERLDIKYTPQLSIVVDESIKKSLEVARILKEVLPPKQEDQVEDEFEDDDELTDDEQEAAEVEAADESDPNDQKAPSPS